MYVARGPEQRMKEICEISYSVTRDLHPLESQGYVATSFCVFKKKKKTLIVLIVFFAINLWTVTTLTTINQGRENETMRGYGSMVERKREEREKRKLR